MTEQELQAIKERVEKATHGEWLLCHGEILTKDEHQLIAYPLPTGIEWENRHDKYFIKNAVTDVQILIAEVERYKNVYEICERGMFKAHDLYKDTQEKLGQVELAEAKARMEIEQLEIKVKNQAAQLIEYQKSFSKMKDQKRTVERMAYNRKQTIKQLRSLVGKLQKRLKSANKVGSGSNV